jgi:hypothetical protein
MNDKVGYFEKKQNQQNSRYTNQEKGEKVQVNRIRGGKGKHYK